MTLENPAFGFVLSRVEKVRYLHSELEHSFGAADTAIGGHLDILEPTLRNRIPRQAAHDRIDARRN